MTDVDLDRFRSTQTEHDRALGEIRAGRKRSHWMWYVFPQASGLGLSELSRRYAIMSIEEAGAYLDDPGLRSDYIEMVDAVWDQVADSGVTVHDLFGSPDDAKLVSSLTLFAGVARTRTPELSQLIAQAEAILAAAGAQELEPCQITMAFLRAGDR